MPAAALILGGARSGKSAYAERLALTRAGGGELVYLATAEALDQEMAERIAHHQARRGPAWRLVEAPRAAPEAILAHSAADRVVLVDCLTLWLSNMMMVEADLDAETRRMVEAIAAAAGPVIAVSNEVGLGIAPENALARRFRDAQGRLNQQAAAAAELVVLMAAGLPLVLKGEAPE